MFHFEHFRHSTHNLHNVKPNYSPFLYVIGRPNKFVVECRSKLLHYIKTQLYGEIIKYSTYVVCLVNCAWED